MSYNLYTERDFVGSYTADQLAAVIAELTESGEATITFKRVEKETT